MLELEVVDPLTSWGSDVKAHLPSADEDAIVIELENTANDFLRKSRTFSHETTLALEEGTSVYKLNPIPVSWGPAGTSFGGVHALYVIYILYDNRVVPLLNFKPRKPYWTASSSTAIFSAWCPNPSEIELFPTPTTSHTSLPLYVRVSLSLGFPISNLPRFLVDNYYEAILHGTVGRMMKHVKRPYYDKLESREHLMTYRNELRIARDEAIRRWSTANASFVFPATWTSRTSGFMRA